MPCGGGRQGVAAAASHAARGARARRRQRGSGDHDHGERRTRARARAWGCGRGRCDVCVEAGRSLLQIRKRGLGRGRKLARDAAAKKSRGPADAGTTPGASWARL
eukprot:350322-Chlamydomonas_euryale.AAC.1